MKWIKYKVVQSTAGGETVFLDKKVGYSTENLAIATAEAYNSSYTIEEDSTAFASEPIGIAFGGTGAKTAADARANLGALSNGAGAVGTTNLGNKVVTAAKLATDAVKLMFKSKSVAASAFVSNSTYVDFPYRASIALTDVTAAMIPEVFFGVADAISGNFAPVAESYNGGVYIYAAEKPSATITIPTIICWR